jgi:cytochrome c
MNDLVARLARSLGVAALALLGTSACTPGGEYRPRVDAGNAQRGAAVIARLECVACHVISGIPGAPAHTGPELDDYALRPYVAGKFPNDPDTLVRFIRNPPALAPLTAMPAVPMTDQDARDIAAFLYEET